MAKSEKVCFWLKMSTLGQRLIGIDASLCSNMALRLELNVHRPKHTSNQSFDNITHSELRSGQTSKKERCSAQNCNHTRNLGHYSSNSGTSTSTTSGAVGATRSRTLMEPLQSVSGYRNCLYPGLFQMAPLKMMM